jgi:hypothetical protein
MSEIKNFNSGKTHIETALYAKLIADAVNPYSLYNNSDRLGNVPYRYFTLGGPQKLSIWNYLLHSFLQAAGSRKRN